ncbi:Diaminopimelate decarboxylase [Fulvivirga imtechensis AK7]|uniref:Diaminopimelate decarboxylase n=1 Tax=Fulvivirga imtechensis AK7 TaxID=1237149 RepID=L8JVM5_9BACT|nr:diaminopimelate decarboxylase [Fulvivirga imtechensis]ELR72850.1 Diaminopimelate decarboxylase [Fulvivirga imtechensis AK7]
MDIKNNTYQVQGLDLVKVVKEFDSPLYVYDADKIVSQLQKLKNAFSNQKIRVKYAVKALSNISILKLLKKHGAGVDVVSVQEAKLALKAGFEPGDILFTPNCVSFEEIQQGVDMGLMINIDNISILEQFGHKYRNSVPCCVRLNPHIMAGGNTKISTGHVDSKFGISIYQLPHLLRVIKTTNIDVIGLHMHTGSDILDADVFLKVAEILYGVAREFPNLEFVDFGSGFKVGYKENDITTNVYDLGVKLGKSFDDFCETYGRKLEMWFEPGKYLVSESGYFLVRANVIKTTPATVFVGVDSGMNHLLRPMMYDAYHEIINISNPKGIQRVYSIVGYICETDTFGWDRKLNEVREGDILAIKNAGAYGFSMSSNYNSRYRPAEVLIYEGKAHLIRERETMEDILRNQVEIDL